MGEIIETPARIAQHYSAAMDSVNLINRLLAKSAQTADDIDTIDRNVEHLKIMASKPFWTKEDLKPITACIAR